MFASVTGTTTRLTQISHLARADHLNWSNPVVSAARLDFFCYTPCLYDEIRKERGVTVGVLRPVQTYAGLAYEVPGNGNRVQWSGINNRVYPANSDASFASVFSVTAVANGATLLATGGSNNGELRFEKPGSNNLWLTKGGIVNITLLASPFVVGGTYFAAVSYQHSSGRWYVVLKQLDSAISGKLITNSGTQTGTFGGGNKVFSMFGTSGFPNQLPIPIVYAAFAPFQWPDNLMHAWARDPMQILGGPLAWTPTYGVAVAADVYSGRGIGRGIARGVIR